MLEAVKIHCSTCLTHWHVSGLPIRGQFVAESTIAPDWQEMTTTERVHLQTRWFYQCPNGCAQPLDYYIAELADAR